MKPFQIFLFFLVILFLLFAISLIFPSEGIEITKGVKLHFPSYTELRKDTTAASYKNISYILEHIEEESLDIPGEPFGSDTSEILIPPDTNPEQAQRFSGINPDSISSLVYPLYYPENDPAVLYPFFNQLDIIRESGKTVRILHYGDSQIEGDRVSSYIRHRLQRDFGGCGPGLVSPGMVVQHTISVKQTVSSNWKRFTIRDVRESVIRHNRLGIMLSFGRFTSPDSMIYYDAAHQEKATIEIEPSGLGYPEVTHFDLCKIFYGYNRTPVQISVETDDTVFYTSTLPENQSLNVHVIEVGKKTNNLILRFEGADSPDIYGISLEGYNGIAVDNIPVRGSSGLEFSQTDPGLLTDMLTGLNTALILFEFGVNVAPNIVKGYSYYENGLLRQLETLKNLKPDINIIVLGISDLSRKVMDSYESYPNIKKIRDAQRNAAFRAGCGFWDTFEAMGGENSMPSWVFSDPPLARKDFIHFSNIGSRIIGEMFYNALMEDYKRYLVYNQQNGHE